MTILIFLILRFLNICQASNRGGNQARETRSERAPLLSQKDDDISSHGSSYDSISQDEQDLDELLAVNSSLEGKALAQGENLYRLCASCFDARRDCFFLPCGHCVACFNCGTRYLQITVTLCPRKKVTCTLYILVILFLSSISLFSCIFFKLESYETSNSVLLDRIAEEAATCPICRRTIKKVRKIFTV